MTDNFDSAYRKANRKGVGPELSYKDGKFILTEGRLSRSVMPYWRDGVLRIGCTTVTREAFEKILEVSG